MPGTAVVERIDGFTRLEEYIRVLGGAAQDGMFRRQGAGAMGADEFIVDHGAQVVIGQLFDLGDFMRGAEAIEEMQEGHACFQRGGLGDQGHVMRFLNRAGGQHGPTGLAAGHHIGVVAKDGEGMRCHGAG